MHTLPAGMSDNGHPFLDEVTECEEGGLDGPLHGADKDEADIEVFGDPGEDIGSEFGALLPAELGEFGVMDAVLL